MQTVRAPQHVAISFPHVRALRKALLPDHDRCAKCGAVQWTPKTFADKLGVTLSAVTNWMYGYTEPSTEHRRAIKRILGVEWGSK